MNELNIRQVEGRGRQQVEYALRYPATDGGNTPFDRYWQGQIQQLRYQLARDAGRFPTRYTSEWQLTRQDIRFCSGFLEVYRKVGHSDWSMWRIAGTFAPKSERPLPLFALFCSTFGDRYIGSIPSSKYCGDMNNLYTNV